MRRHVAYVPPIKDDFAVGCSLNEVGDRLQRGCLSSAIAAEQCYDFALFDLEGNAAKGLDLSVTEVQISYFQYFISHPSHPQDMQR